MSRRLKHRIPEALRANVRRLPPIVLLVTATIVITPQAMAQLQEEKASPVFVFGAAKEAKSNVWTKTYTKDELKQKVPANPVTTIEQRIGSEITQLFRSLTRAQRKEKDWKKLYTAQPDEDTYNIQIAALKDGPTTPETNVEGVRMRLGGEMQKALSSRVKSELTLLNKMSSGVGFNLDVGNLFADDKASMPKKTSGSVRYGLILQDIEPGDAPDRAAIGDTPAEEMEYAGHADVKWTIGPITEEQGRRLFDLKEKEAEAEKTSSFWSRFKLPKFAFKGKASPENFDNLSGVNADNLPNWRVDFAQQDDLYSMVYKTKTNGEMISTEHQVKIPVAGTIALGRRFDDNFKVVQTSAYNILYDQRLPLVSLHQMHIEDRYRADLTYRVDDHAISFVARSEAKGVVEKEAQRPENYSVEYGHEF